MDPDGTSPFASEYMNDTPSSTAIAPGPNSGGSERPVLRGSVIGVARFSSVRAGQGSAGVARRGAWVTGASIGGISASLERRSGTDTRFDPRTHRDDLSSGPTAQTRRRSCED